jgi:hypothetical protein|tara:strand:+ start:903 stop:1226 length:324 start_codon:yes stop_codon:yes gene_type:complete
VKAVFLGRTTTIGALGTDGRAFKDDGTTTSITVYFTITARWSISIFETLGRLLGQSLRKVTFNDGRLIAQVNDLLEPTEGALELLATNVKLEVSPAAITWKGPTCRR